MKTIMITGGCGFIGSNLIDYMLTKHSDIKVLNIDKLTYVSNKTFLSSKYSSDKRYSFINLDICKEDAIYRVLKKNEVDYIINMAGETNVDKSITKDKDFIISNIFGTYSVLSAAYKAWGTETDSFVNHRFIQISTDEVHGQLLSEGPKFNENTLVRPRNPYSATKASAEHLAMAYYETHGLPVVVARLTNNYGPNQFPEKLVPIVIKSCMKKEIIPIYGDGKSIRNWIYVKDTCEAIDILVNKGERGQVYLVGSSYECANIDIAKRIIEFFRENIDANINNDLICYTKERKGNDCRYSVDSFKMSNTFNWTAKTDIKDGLAETIHWYLDNLDNWEIKENNCEHSFINRRSKDIQ